MVREDETRLSPVGIGVLRKQQRRGERNELHARGDDERSGEPVAHDHERHGVDDERKHDCRDPDRVSVTARNHRPDLRRVGVARGDGGGQDGAGDYEPERERRTDPHGTWTTSGRLAM